MQEHLPFSVAGMEKEVVGGSCKALVEVSKNRSKKLENIFKKELTMRIFCISMLMKVRII